MQTAGRVASINPEYRPKCHRFTSDLALCIIDLNRWIREGRSRKGTVALVDQRPRLSALGSVCGSDRFGEFVERCRDCQMFMAGFDAEFVVSSSQILDERVISDHNRRGLIGPQAAHRSQPCLETPVVVLYPVV